MELNNVFDISLTSYKLSSKLLNKKVLNLQEYELINQYYKTISMYDNKLSSLICNYEKLIESYDIIIEITNETEPKELKDKVKIKLELVKNYYRVVNGLLNDLKYRLGLLR